MTGDEHAREVLLVGSVPLSSATEVFESVSTTLGPLVRRIPDGETGARSEWIDWQVATLLRAKGIEVRSERLVVNKLRRIFGIKPGAGDGDIDLGALGYAEVALTSYDEFRRLRAAGKIPAATRFQVSLPTPIALAFGFFVPEDVRRMWPIFERALIAEVGRLAAAIPQHDLAIQWDIAYELVRILEQPDLVDQYPLAELAAAIQRVVDAAPDRVEVGLHLCYGDPGHKHVLEPKDTGLMVALTNAVDAATRRRIDWVHIPVPRDRDDRGYFEPLRGLRLKSDTTIFLGLIHITDGLEGAKRRIAAAKLALPRFGVATECGFGRRPPDTIPPLLALHEQVARAEA